MGLVISRPTTARSISKEHVLGVTSFHLTNVASIPKGLVSGGSILRPVISLPLPIDGALDATNSHLTNVDPIPKRVVSDGSTSRLANRCSMPDERSLNGLTSPVAKVIADIHICRATGEPKTGHQGGTDTQSISVTGPISLAAAGAPIPRLVVLQGINTTGRHIASDPRSMRAAGLNSPAAKPSSDPALAALQGTQATGCHSAVETRSRGAAGSISFVAEVDLTPVGVPPRRAIFPAANVDSIPRLDTLQEPNQPAAYLPMTPEGDMRPVQISVQPEEEC